MRAGFRIKRFYKFDASLITNKQNINSTMKKSLAIVGMVICSLFAEAQVQIPAASPAGSVTSRVGLTDIKVEYSRPKAKGRVIFGEASKGVLVPYGQIWRTGANTGTKVTF